MATGNAVAQQAPSPREVVANLQATLAKYEPHLRNLLPPNVDPSRLTRLAVVAASKNPDLLNCSAQSIVLAVLRVAQLNLELGVTAHLVPYGKEVQCIVDYKGTIELAMRSGYVKSVDAWVVYEHDVFEVTYGTDPAIVHHPNMKDRGAAVGVYAVYTLQDGIKKFDYMTTTEVETIRNGRMGPWSNHWGEMAKKTVIRRTGKLVPQSPEMSAAWAMHDRSEGYQTANPLLDEGEAIVTNISQSVIDVGGNS